MTDLFRKKVSIKDSFLTKFVLMVILIQVLVVSITGYIYIQKLSVSVRDKSAMASRAAIENYSGYVGSILKSIGENLSLLASMPDIYQFEEDAASRLLKNYKISALFISGESVRLYDPDNNFITDNEMIRTLKANTFPEFHLVDPLRPYSGKISWKNNVPYKTIAVTVQNFSKANGVLLAEVSFSRFFKITSSYSVGEAGFIFVTDQKGNLLIHPDRKFLKNRETLSGLGLNQIDLQNSMLQAPQFYRLSDGKDYLVNYHWDPQWKLGYFSVQPKLEIERISNRLRMGVIILLLLVISISSLLSVVLSVQLIKPLNQLTRKMFLVRDGFLDEASGIKGNDEIGVLAEGFDSMRISLKTHIRELAEHQENLERQIEARTAELVKTNESLERISRTDPLTELSNRREIMERIEHEKYRSERTGRPFSFIMADIDHFKKFNDEYGHQCGDAVLKGVAEIFRHTLRRNDYIARWGGEEFLVVLTETDYKHAILAAERVKRAAEKTLILHEGKEFNVKLSFGVHEYDHSEGIEKGINTTDACMYKSKENGRNRVCGSDGYESKLK
jgi:diguanylate cyclase (GGDEF)-like protein